MGWLFRDEVEFGGDGPTAESESMRQANEREAERASGRRSRKFWSLVKHMSDGAGDAFDAGVTGAYGAMQKGTDVDDWRRAASEMSSGTWSIWKDQK